MKIFNSVFKKLFSWGKIVLGPVFVLMFSFFASGLGLWYTIWFSLGSVYLYYHWEKAMVFFPFNGHALIFTVWLIMIFRPFIKDVNSPWFNINFNDIKKKQKDTKKEFEKKLASEEINTVQTKHGGQND